MGIRFGAAFWAQRTGWPELRDAALAAECAGFDSLWLDDHLLDDEGDPSADKLEGWTTLAALAPLTHRATLGHLVTANTFRAPALVAKMAITLDHLSAGRAVLGLGAGWFELEHTAYGLEFGPWVGERLDRLGEALAIARRLLDGERFDFDGRFYRLRGAIARPRPIQAHLPILVGGMGPRKTLPLVARYADHWNAYGSPEAVSGAAATLAERCLEIGRDPATIERSVNLNVVVRDSVEAAAEAWAAVRTIHEPQPGEDALDAGGPPEVVAEALRPYLGAGVGHVVWVLRSPWDLETISRVREVRALLDP